MGLGRARDVAAAARTATSAAPTDTSPSDRSSSLSWKPNPDQATAGDPGVLDRVGGRVALDAEEVVVRACAQSFEEAVDLLTLVEGESCAFAHGCGLFIEK